MWWGFKKIVWLGIDRGINANDGDDYVEDDDVINVGSDSESS